MCTIQTRALFDLPIACEMHTRLRNKDNVILKIIFHEYTVSISIVMPLIGRLFYKAAVKGECTPKTQGSVVKSFLPCVFL